MNGVMREPLLKPLHFLRAMEFVSKDGRSVELFQLREEIGMQAYESPGVFNFYLPEYQPAGVISDAGLYAPETQIMTGPTLIGYLNGMYSLINCACVRVRASPLPESQISAPALRRPYRLQRRLRRRLLRARRLMRFY